MNKNMKTNINIFISYCWKNKDVADKINEDFQKVGITTVKDSHQLKYQDSISDFMKRIRETDYALILISDEYLKSKNCMNEISLLLKEKDVWNKFLPIIISGTTIYTADDRMKYIKHWYNQKEKLKKTLESVEITHALGSYQELKFYDSILNFMDDFLLKIADGLNIPFDDLQKSGYKEIFNKIGVQEKSYLIDLIVIDNIKNIEFRELALEEHQKKYGESCELYSIKGLAESRNGKFTKSEFYYLKALEINPNEPYVLNNLGYLYEYGMKRIIKAKNLYEAAIKNYPNFVIARLNLGVLFANMGNTEQALNQYNEVLKIEPSNAKAHHNIANQYKLPENLNIEKAIFHVKKAMEFDPQYVEAFMSYANILKCWLKDIDEGNKYYRKALKLDKNGFFKASIKRMMKSPKG